MAYKCFILGFLLFSGIATAMKRKLDAGESPESHGKKSVSASASASAKAPHYDYDTIVVGAGIVGSGIGYQLAQLYKMRVLILEKVEISLPTNYM